jgi:ketosteroid isomerase-like protein
MSQENVEIVSRIYKAAASRDTAAIFDLYDEDVVLDGSRVSLPGNEMVYKGHEGLREFFRIWHEAWGQVNYDYEELLEVGEEKVVAVVNRRVRGRSSALDLERRFALLWTIRAGRAVRVVWFLNRTDALEAAGLSE